MSPVAELQYLVADELQTHPERLLPAYEPFEAGLAIFSDVLLEPGGTQIRRRRMAGVVSFILQCLFVALALIAPLMYTDALPTPQLVTFLVAPTPPPPPPPPAAAVPVRVLRQSQIMNTGQLRAPASIPKKIEMVKEDEAPPAITGVVGGVTGGIPGGQLGGVIGGIIASTHTTAMVPKLATATPKRMRVSQGVTQGMILRKIQPPYPPIAKAARVQGQVVLAAVISKEGTIENLQLIAGSPLLAPAAIEAVKQWQYRPFLLNGQPVEVDTTVSVTFQFEQ